MFRPVLLPLLLATLLAAPPALAQAYKCRTPGGGTTISSTPCTNGEKTERAVSEAVASPAASSDAQRDQAALDAKVAAALANGDYERARTLAVTAHHWQMIAEAERSRPQATRSSASSTDWRAEARNSQECRDAQRNYDVDAGAIGANPTKVEASKQHMYAACGIDPPASTTINVNSGVGTTRQAILPYPPRRATGTTTTTTTTTTGSTTRNKSGLYNADPSTYRSP